MPKRPENQTDYYKFPTGGVVISQCAFCKNKSEDGPTCTAYPDGIPEPILTNKVMHNKPIKGDHGIQFDPEFDDAPIQFEEEGTNS